MLGAKYDRLDQIERNHLAQFGGISFGVGGLGIAVPVFGSGGFSPPGGGFSAPGVGGGGIGPLLTLEQVFGTGFTAQSVADAIRVNEQDARFDAETGTLQTIVDIATGPELSIVLNITKGLFEIFNSQGQKLGGGVTPEAAIAAVNAGAPPAGGGGAASEPPIFPEALTAVTTAPFQAPTTSLDTPTASTLRDLAAILGNILRTDEPEFRIPPQPQQFPPVGPVPPAPPAGRVLPGGTVNAPVVLGSTGDPTGVRRPTFPNQDELSRAQQIGQLIREFLLLREARQNADKQRRAFEQFLQARLAQLGGQQMPFGQAGFAAGALVPSVGSFLGNVGADILAGLISPGQQPQLPALPAFPQGAIGPTISGMPMGGGGCPPLFRGGAPSARMSPVPWFPVQGPNGKWFFFGHLGTPKFSKLKAPRRHHHHSRKR